MTTVAAALIVKNCEDSLPACLESIRPHVDEIVVVDTGSTDRTPVIAAEFGAKVDVFTECNRNPLSGQLDSVIWDFSAARNRSFELVESEFAWWQDSDDVVLGAETLRAAASAAPPGNFAYLAPYEYAYDQAGRPTCIHWRERLIRNPRDMVWTTPCHEVCVPRSGSIQHAPLPNVLIKHRAQEIAAKPGATPREPRRNIRILEAYLKRVHEGDPRAMYYTGVEYARHGQFGKARDVLKRYVQLSNWDDERCLAELELARIYLHEGECQEAIRWCMQAMTTKDWPNAYWVLVNAFARLADEGPLALREYNLRRIDTWAARGRALKDAETVLFYDPTERYTTERIVARVYATWNEMDAAAEACRRGLAGLPGDPELMELLRGLEKVRIARDIDTSLSRLVHLGAVSEQVKAHIERAVATNSVPAASANQNGGIVGMGTMLPEFGGGQIPRYRLPGVPLIIGGPVVSAEDWAAVQALGVTHVCSVTNPPDIGVPAEVSLHAPVPDAGVPFSDEQLEKVVGFASQCFSAGGALYLHCWVGASRSPSHGFAILRALFGVSPQQALGMIQSVYPYGTFGAEPKHQNYINGIEQWLARRARGPFARIGTGEAVDVSGLPPVPEGKLDIVIVTGPAMEEWSPRTIEETGIGGSETMAWEMARHLARLGHRVRHYGHCKPEQEGIYEGVHWLDSARYRDIECDALVVSRYADLVATVGGVKAKTRLLWVHDCWPHNLTPQHALRYDKVLCLSNWHKQTVAETHPFLDPERIVVTRNGIDLGLFEPRCDKCGGFRGASGGVTFPECDTCHGDLQLLRNPHRAVYSSSPDRGLQTALELWPLVRAEVPDAELHVYYGFTGLRALGGANAALADKLEAQAKATEGVVLHGRVSPRELAREFMRSGVWFMPEWFSETSCLTAMQAQAAGLRCVATPIAALNETLGHRGFLVPNPPGPTNIAHSFECAQPSEEFRAEFVTATVTAMRYNLDARRAQEAWLDREWVMAQARERFGLPELARIWEQQLTELCADQPMPRFYVDPAMAAVARETDEAA